MFWKYNIYSRVYLLTRNLLTVTLVEGHFIIIVTGCFENKRKEVNVTGVYIGQKRKENRN